MLNLTIFIDVYGLSTNLIKGYKVIKNKLDILNCKILVKSEYLERNLT